MTEPRQEVHDEKEKQPKKVDITVDQKKRQVRPGEWVVADLKREIKVDPSLDLDQLVDGQFVPLANDARITIVGGEVFISHVPQGGSS